MDIWGEKDVAAVRYSDSWMRSQVRRWTPKAEELSVGGPRELVPRMLTEERSRRVQRRCLDRGNAVAGPLVWR